MDQLYTVAAALQAGTIISTRQVADSYELLPRKHTRVDDKRYCTKTKWLKNLILQFLPNVVCEKSLRKNELEIFYSNKKAISFWFMPSNISRNHLTVSMTAKKTLHRCVKLQSFCEEKSLTTKKTVSRLSQDRYVMRKACCPKSFSGS